MAVRTLLLLALCACVLAMPTEMHLNNDDNALGNDPTVYQVGAGIYDVTGPAAETGMMGYAMVKQKTHGLHFRQRARTVIIEDYQGNRVVHTSTDICMTYQSLKLTVVKRLQAKYGKMYTVDNVLISGIHTHAGPGGYSWYVLYDVTTAGFSKQNFDAIVDGIVQSIVRAHESMRPSHIFFNQGKLVNSNINRSPTAYLMNSEEERAKYPDGDTDKTMAVLRFQDLNGKDFAAIGWFAVHCTSMFNTNLLISGDNKGMASYLFERHMNPTDMPPGSKDGFVALFPQTNSGDVSPNTAGPSCPDGSKCDILHSTCGGRNEGCQGRGPAGTDDFKNTEIIGGLQMQAALDLFNNATEYLNGTVDFRHTFQDMSNQAVQGKFTQKGKDGNTCRAAMGYAFAAGTTDGPGEFDFTQADNNTQGNPFWNFISSFLAKPTQDQIQCQAPKPILLDVGQIKPSHWTPTVLPTQVLKIGQLLIPAVPAEFTTMAGRRAREFVAKAAEETAGKPYHVVLAGYANAYASYVATQLEYDQQRYEAASTLYGPFTLGAYIQSLDALTRDLLSGKASPDGPTPLDLSSHTISFEPPVIVDGVPSGKKFGDVEMQPQASYRAGDTVTAQFWGANPRNNLLTESTFMTVEKKGDAGTWTVVFTDSHIETRYRWERRGLDHSLITQEWDISSDVAPGTYRMRTFGYSKDLLQVKKAYSGATQEFTVTQ